MDFSLLPQNISAEITDNHLRNARQGTQQAFRVEKDTPAIRATTPDTNGLLRIVCDL